MLIVAGAATCWSVPAAACELALAFAVDISGSVDAGEYEIQMRGLAEGLRDGVVSESLVRSGAHLMLVQWSGTSRQSISVPWTRIEDFQDVEDFAKRVEMAPRAWRIYSTAIGDALDFMLPLFTQVDACERHVIDVSGDGVSNEGREPKFLLPAVRNAGITVNALVIEGVDADLTGYFWENVVTGDGAFVVTANGFAEYAAKIRKKLVREVSKALSDTGDYSRPGQVVPASAAREFPMPL